MAASSSSAATVNQSDHSSLAEEPEAEPEFCPGFKDVDAFVKVSWWFQCVNPAVRAVTNCKHKRNVGKSGHARIRSNVRGLYFHNVKLQWMYWSVVCFLSMVWERWCLPRRRPQLFPQPEMSLTCTEASPPSSTSAPHRGTGSYTGKTPYSSTGPVDIYYTIYIRNNISWVFESKD